MSIGDFFLRKVASFFKVSDSYDYVKLIQKVGHPSSVSLPPDLIPMAGKMLTRAAANQVMMNVNRDWVLPFWAHRQFTPGDPAFIPRMSWTSFNLCHRNWTATGNYDSDREVTVDPRGLVTPWFEAWSVDFRLLAGDEFITPSRMPDKAVSQCAVDCLPIIKTQIKGGKATLTTECFATGGKKEDMVAMSAEVVNSTKKPMDYRFFVSIRPYNPEGLYQIHEIEYTDAGCFRIDGSTGLIMAEKPAGTFCCDYRTGDCSLYVDEYKPVKSVECEVGLATAFAEYKFTLKPGESKKLAFYSPTKKRKIANRVVERYKTADLAAQRSEYESEWKTRASQGMRISVPDDKVQQAFDTHKAYLHLFDDGDYITPGVSLYHHYWFRDSAYMVTALDRMGFADRAEKKLLSYPGRQRADGFYLSQDGEWDSAGQALWTLAEHYRITGDRQFLAKMFGSMSNGARWIHRKTIETKDAPSPHYGLLPAGFSAEHFGPNDYYYWDDFWAIAGLRDTAYAAKVLGHRELQNEFLGYHDKLWSNITASLDKVEKRLGKRIMPTSPHRRFDSAAVGTLCTVHPLKIMDPGDPLVVNTVSGLMDKHFYEDGFIIEIIHSGINCYLSLHIAQALAARGDKRAWDIANYLLSIASDALTWPEAVHAVTKGGCMGDGMHGWATADFLMFVRSSLLDENKNTLSITPCIPDSWYHKGRTVKVADAPTHFGPVTFEIESGAKGIELNIKGKWRNPPEKIIWGTPVRAKTFMVNGKRVKAVNGGIEFSHKAKHVKIGRVD